jgi:hypothetical protein
MVAIVVEGEMEPLALTLFAICFAVMTIIGVHEADAVDKAIGGLSWPLAIRVTIAFSTAFACLGLLRWSLWFWPIAGLALAAANALAVSDKAAFAASSCTLNRDAYELVLDAGSALRKIRVPRTKIFLFSDYGEELVLGEGCEQRHALLSGVNDAIVAYGEFQYAAPAWSRKTLETLEPERWREMVTTHGAIAFLTYNPARISVLRDKVQAAGGTPGEASAFRFRAGDMELPLYVLPFD